MTPVEVTRGTGPIVMGLPHTGTYLPRDIRLKLNDTGLALADTDWHIHNLYNGLMDDVTMVRATFHRYVIDANRDPAGHSLYPGQNTTGLVPLTDFDGNDIWQSPPTAADTDSRRAQFHAPYHAALETELHRARAAHGIAILFDCHSIRSRIPYLFDGILPDFNIGTNATTTCAPEIEATVTDICAHAQGFTSITNGRFKGGWTTRHYGQPGNNIHAIQMELAQSAYLTAEAPPWAYDTAKAHRLRPHLRAILRALAILAENLKTP